jgi:hypothetical protein
MNFLVTASCSCFAGPLKVEILESERELLMK